MGSGERDIVTDERVEAVAAEGEHVVGPDDALRWREVIAVDLFAVLRQFLVVEAGFEGGESSMTPARAGHDVDEFEFERRFGLELIGVGTKQVFVVGLGFAGQDDLFGGEAVLAGVLGDLGFAGRGDGAGGFGGVGAVGFCFAHVSSRGG